MKTVYSILLLFLVSSIVRGQQLYIDSTRFITGINVGTNINYAIPTADKGILFTGIAWDTPGGIIPYSPYIGENVMVGKIDSNHLISWIKIYGGNGDDNNASCAVQTPDGGYAILCTTASSDGEVTGFHGVMDAWLFRLDDTGKFLWGNCYGSSSQDMGVSVAYTPDNGFIVLGLTNGNDGDVPFHYGDWTTFDWMVIKTDSVGNVQWSKDMGGTVDEGLGSIFANDNGYYIAATSASVDHDCNDTAWHPTIPWTGTGLNYYLLRLDSAGNELWDSCYGGSHSDVISHAMFDARDSTIVMMGYTSSDDYMVTGYHMCVPAGTTIGFYDMWVVKTDKVGKLLWQKTLGSDQVEYGNSICAAPNGGYTAYGYTYAGVCYDSAIEHIGAQDCWLFLLDSSGNIVSNKIFGGVNGDISYSVVPYLNGYAAVGNSGSYAFTEGTTYGNFDTSAANPDGGGAFISYIGYSPLAVNNVRSLAESTLKVYPNPTQEEANVILPDKSSAYLAVSNILGQTVYKEEVQTKLVKIDMRLWPGGLYQVVWHGADGSVLAAKLVKQ